MKDIKTYYCCWCDVDISIWDEKGISKGTVTEKVRVFTTMHPFDFEFEINEKENKSIKDELNGHTKRACWFVTGWKEIDKITFLRHKGFNLEYP